MLVLQEKKSVWSCAAYTFNKLLEISQKGCSKVAWTESKVAIFNESCSNVSAISLLLFSYILSFHQSCDQN